jgi:hypothetical protein
VIEATSGGFYMALDGSQVTITGMGSSGGGTHVIPVSAIKQLEIQGTGRLVIVFRGGMHAHALEPSERPQFDALVSAINKARGD